MHPAIRCAHIRSYEIDAHGLCLGAMLHHYFDVAVLFFCYVIYNVHPSSFYAVFFFHLPICILKFVVFAKILTICCFCKKTTLNILHDGGKFGTTFTFTVFFLSLSNNI